MPDSMQNRPDGGDAMMRQKDIFMWEAVGMAHRSNMFGYATAEAVSQDAYEIPIADLMSSLSGVNLP